MSFRYLERVQPEPIEILKAIFLNGRILREWQGELCALDLRGAVKGRALKSVYAHEGIRRIGGSAQGGVPACLGITLGIPTCARPIDGVTCGTFCKILALIADIEDVTMAQLPLHA